MTMSDLKKQFYNIEDKFLLNLFLPLFRIRQCGLPKSHFYNFQKNILFIHNPKVAGNTIKDVLGLNHKYASHLTPTFLVSKKKWEESYSVVAVRHPIDRLISSYRYHTQKKYKGVYYKKYPFLHQLEIDEYFDLFKKEPFVIRPQVDYTQHYFSSKPVDFIIRYEDLNRDLNELCERLKIPINTIPHLNPSRTKYKEHSFNKAKTFWKKVINYYERDFERFNYSN
jgi:hypothetical protein